MKNICIVLLLSSIVLTGCFEKKEPILNEEENNIIQAEIEQENEGGTEILKSELEEEVMVADEMQEDVAGTPLIEAPGTVTPVVGDKETVITPLGGNTSKSSQITPVQSVNSKPEETPSPEPTQTVSSSLDSSTQATISDDESQDIDELLEGLMQVIGDVEDLNKE